MFGRRTRCLFSTSLALGLLFSISGCAGGEAEVDVSSLWVEPGWMAQARQAEEERVTAMVSCLEGFGVNAEPSLWGGEVSIVLEHIDEHGNLPPGAAELASLAFAECNARVPLPQLWLDWGQPDEAAYQRVLDVRDCLATQGIETPSPPSFEVWREQEFPWGPYNYLFEGERMFSDDELLALFAACPQSGHGRHVLWTDDE